MPLFPNQAGRFWRATDWRNWRKRIYRPVAEEAGVDGARPYVLRHAFASLLIHEGRLSVVDIAAQLGHNPTVCLDTYAHVMAEQRDGLPVSAEEQILQARHGRATAGPVERLEGELIPQNAMPSRSPAVAFGLTPSRVSVGHAQPSGYGVDFTYLGATARADAETARGMLRAAGSKTSIREEFDGGWTVRFGPVGREQVRALLDRFAA